MSAADAPRGPQPATARELQAVIRQEREGVPFLVYRDAAGEHHLIVLDREEHTVGRNPAADLCLEWDGEVSRLHARLERAAGEHALIDDGLSSNGSFVNGERLRGRRRLQDGDMLRFGQTVVMFRLRAQRSGTGGVHGFGQRTAGAQADPRPPQPAAAPTARADAA